MNSLAPRRTHVGAAIAALALAFLTACSEAPRAESTTVAPAHGTDQPQAPDAAPANPAAPASAIIDPDAPDAWRHACLLTNGEMASIVASLGFTITETDGASSSNECYYDDPETSPMGVGIKIWPYSATQSYGFGDGPSWTAPSAAEGYANACASFAAATADRTGPAAAQSEALCDPTVGLGSTISKTRLAGVAFLDGSYLYVVTMYGLPGDDSLIQPMQAILEAIAAAGSPKP